MRIIIFEFVNEVKEYIKLYGLENLKASGSKIVSLDPKVRALLISENVLCEDTTRYFDNDSHKTIVEQVQNVIERVSDGLDIHDDFGLSNTYKQFALYHLKFYLNYMFMCLEMVHNICKETQIEEIFCFASANHITSQAFLSDGERPLAEIIKEYCKGKGIAAHCPKINSNTEGKKAAVLYAITCFGVKLYFRLYFLIKRRQLISPSTKKIMVPTIAYKIKAILERIKGQYKNAYTVFILDIGENIKDLLYVTMVSIYSLLPFKQDNAINCVIPINLWLGFIKNDKEFVRGDFLVKELKGKCVFHNIDVSDLILYKVNLGLTKELNALHTKVAVLNDIWTEVKPRFIFAPYNYSLAGALGEMSKYHKIESCIITHGTHVVPNNRYEEIENYWLAKGVVLNDYQMVALQTPALVSFLDYYKDKRPRLTTGPMVFTSLNGKVQKEQNLRNKFGIAEEKKVILYAATQKLRYGPRFYIVETLDEFISSLNDLVLAVDGLDDYQLLIRPHPCCNLSEVDFKNLLPQSKNCSLNLEGSFSDVLSMADVLVSFSSTCIEEALINYKPVVLYDKWERYNHMNAPKFQEGSFVNNFPVAYVTNKNNLIKYFEGLIKIKSLDLGLFEKYRYDKSLNQNFYDYIGTALAKEN